MADTPLQPPGKERDIHPMPVSAPLSFPSSHKMEGKVVLITGGDSGIGKATALLLAKEGANIAIVYLTEHEDAKTTQQEILALGKKCLTFAGDIADPQFCSTVVTQTVTAFGRLDCLINNAAEQHPQEEITDISPEQLLRTFQTNIFSQFYCTQAALAYLPSGSTIINTASVTAYRGSPELLDYAATKGAIISYTRSLAKALAPKGIRVNAVAPGPVWTPLIPSTFSQEKVENFGKNVPLGRPGQPHEIAPSFLFLASSDSSYMTGQVLHPNGGEVVNG